MRFKFKAKYLPMLARVAAKQDIRYYLCGVHVEAAETGGVYLVATNGHAMLVIHDADGTISDVDPAVASIRVTPATIAAAKVASRMDVEQHVLLSGKRLSVAMDFESEHTSMEVHVQGGDPLVIGKYPDFRKVLPDFSKLQPGCLVDGCDISLSYLSMFNLGGDRYAGSRISVWHTPDDKGRGVVVQALGVPEAVGVIMPAHPGNKIDQLARMAKIMPRKKATPL